MSQTQLNLLIDFHESRRARLERIAAILQGQPSGLVQTADVYFTEQNAKRADAIARQDRLRREPVAEVGARVSLQAANNSQPASDANRPSIRPSRYSAAPTNTAASDTGQHNAV